MNFSILTIVLLGLQLVVVCAVVEFQVRVVMNNGVTGPNMTCSGTQDWSIVSKALNGTRSAASSLRRSNLAIEGEDIDSDTGIVGNKERKLLVTFYPATCKTTCQYFATGTCTAPGCKGFRREMEDMENNRDLQTTFTWCPSATQTAYNSLDSLKTNPLISIACKNLLNQPRNATCISVSC